MSLPIRPLTNLIHTVSSPAGIGHGLSAKSKPMGQQVFLPNGQTYLVTPIFGGFTFKSTDMDIHHSAMPPGWTVILQTEDEVDEYDERIRRRSKVSLHREPTDGEQSAQKHVVAHRFTRPTLQNDTVFISSITLPSSTDFKGPASPTRHIALILYTTLHWYFHKEAPNPHVTTEESQLTPEAGRPKADWKIRVKREGVFKSKNTLQKLERMGLITSEDSCVGIDTDVRSPSGWNAMFVSRRSFWQIDPRIFLFTLAPIVHSPFPSQSPHPSRPSSPERGTGERGSPRQADYIASAGAAGIMSEAAGVASPGGPFNSGSHLPTYYPPPPTQFTFTNHIRHPVRPKPPRQGETFYTRYIPSVAQWLSFRTPTLSSRPVPHFGPTTAGSGTILTTIGAQGSKSVATLPTLSSFQERLCDYELLHKWMNEPRVNASWGEAGPQARQIKFLENGLSSKHSFPVIGCWDGKPFGYFEIYWVKEDKFGRLLGGEVGNYTRGLHCLVGEDDFRGSHRVKAWLSALVHYSWMADIRTETIMMEPRVDNIKFIDYLKEAGFYKQGEISFPHKQSAVMKLDRESWEAPFL